MHRRLRKPSRPSFQQRLVISARRSELAVTRPERRQDALEASLHMVGKVLRVVACGALRDGVVEGRHRGLSRRRPFVQFELTCGTDRELSTDDDAYVPRAENLAVRTACTSVDDALEA